MGHLRTYASPGREREAAYVPAAAGPAPAATTRPSLYAGPAAAGLLAPGHGAGAGRAAAARGAQRHYGNRAVRRLLAAAAVQRKAAGAGASRAGTLGEVVSRRGGGRPLEPGVRAFMEPRFGHDFGGVRVHTDGGANRLARNLNAHGFTSGRDIFFASGAYAPASTAGRRLLAHELSHVVQQRSGAASRLEVGEPGDAYEREAEAAADQVARGGSARVAAARPPLLQRACVDRRTTELGEYGINWSRAGAIAEVRVVREYGRQFGKENVYFGIADQRVLRTFLAASEADSRAMYGILAKDRPGFKPDILDPRSKEFYDVKSVDDKQASETVQRYQSMLDKLYDAYHRSPIVGAGTPPFQLRDPALLDARYRRGRSFVPPDLDLGPVFTLKMSLPEPGVLAYRYCVDVDQRIVGAGLGERLSRAVEGEADPYLIAPVPRRLVTLESPRVPKRLVRLPLSPRAIEVELPERARPGKPVTRSIRGPSRRVMPGLEFQEATLDLGPDLRPVGGKVKAEPKLPFLARDRARELTFAVDGTGRVQLSFKVPLRMGGLGRAELELQAQDGALRGRTTFTPTPKFLQHARAEVVYEDGQVHGGIAFTPEAFSLPVPGLTVEHVQGGLLFDGEGISGEGGCLLRYRGLGEASLRVGYKGQLVVDGTLLVAVGGMEPVTGSIRYRGGKLVAEVRLTKRHFPAGLPLESGGIVVRLVDGQPEGEGSVGVRLGPVGRGRLSFAYAGGDVDLAATINVKLPGMQGGTVTVRYLRGQLEGEGDLPIDARGLPGLSGKVHVEYREGRFAGRTQVDYAKGELAGSVVIAVEQLEDGSLQASGSGEVSGQVTPWLTGRVLVEITPAADVIVHSEIRAPDEVPLFPYKEIPQHRAFPRIEFPLWGFRIPVVGTVGIVAFIEGGGGFVVFAGPGVLRNIGIAGSFGTKEGEGPTFDISGEFFMGAGAEAYVYVKGGIELGAAVADVEGSIQLTGSVGTLATLSVVPHIGYANGDYYFRGDAELQALAYLRFRGVARAAVSVIFYGEVWSEEWPLFDWVYPLGLNVALRGRVDYVFGRPFEPRFEFRADELDPLKIVKEAVPSPGARPRAGPAVGPTPRTALRTEEVPTTRPAPAGQAPAAPARAAAAGAAPAPRPAVVPPRAAPVRAAAPARPAVAAARAAPTVARPAAAAPAPPARRAAVRSAATGATAAPRPAAQPPAARAAVAPAALPARPPARPAGPPAPPLQEPPAARPPARAAAGPRPAGPRPSGPSGPTGLTPRDPIPLRWFKHPSYYPPFLELGGHRYDRDQPTRLPRGEPIGVRPRYLPRVGKLVRLLPRPDEGRRREFAAVLGTRYGFDWSGLDADHLQDLQWDGPDAFDNLWPMDRSANRSAGPRQNQTQRVGYTDEYGQAASITLGEGLRTGRLVGRWFVIAEIRD